MKSFVCEFCRKAIEIDLNGIYTTECEHYPAKGLSWEQLSTLMSTMNSKHAAMVKLSHAELLNLHVRALACHCECLGMNAENSLAVCNNTKPPYSDDSYLSVLQKWRLVDGNYRPVI